MKQKNVVLVPIIISQCLRDQYSKLRELQAITPINKIFPDIKNGDNSYFIDICKRLKVTLDKKTKFKNVDLTDNMKNFLNDMELITNAHSEKKKIVLDDIFIYPELLKFNNGLDEYNETVNSEIIIDELLSNERILIQ
jgi:hypothetical protein